MPYVEGFGTWPFGEEWLWEAIATSYLPLLDVLKEGAPFTVSVTPVLADQLQAPGAMERCEAFLHDLRRASHVLDIDACREAGREDLAVELERACAEYAASADAVAGLGADGLLARLAPFVSWTSSATHAVLPLLATDAGVRLQVETGIASHRRRFGDWGGGFWLPECAYAPWLDHFLEEAGVHAVCVELTDIFGLGDARHLTPLRSGDGPILVPIDRALIDVVWGAAGYPGGAAYRDYHHRTSRDHHPWANDGAVYDLARAHAQAEADAADYVARCAARIANGGLCVLAFDTELFGHWWHEGPVFLAAFAREARRVGLPLVGLDDALAAVDTVAVPVGYGATTTWGDPHTLQTWSAPDVADIAVSLRDAELRVVAAGPTVSEDVARALLAVQASDWAFMAHREQAGDYPRERLAGHLQGLTDALDQLPSASASVRHLAPHASTAPLLEP